MKKTYMKKAFLLVLLFPLLCLSQTSYIDSLSDITYNHPSSDDSTQMHNYVLLVRAHIANKTTDSLLPVSKKAIEFAKEKNKPEYLANSYNLHGVYYKINKEFNQAIEIFNIAHGYLKQIKTPNRIQCVVNYNLCNSHAILGNLDSSYIYARQSYQAAVATNDINYQSLTLSSIARYYINIGSFPKALDHLNKSLKLAIDEQDTAKIISAKLNIGKVLSDFEKHDEMIDLYYKLLDDYDSTALASQMDLINLNLGAAYSELGNQDKSLEYTYKVLNSNSNLRRGLANGNIGETYLKLLKSGIPPSQIPILEELNLENDEQKNKKVVLNIISDHFTKSFEDFDEINASNYKIYPLMNIGEYYNYIDNHKKSVEAFKDAWDIAEDNNLLNEQKKIAKQIYEQYKHLNKSTASLEWYEKYILIKDSLNSKESQQEIGKQLAQFEFTNVRLKDSLEQVKKDAIQQIKIKQQSQNIKNERLKKYYLYGGLLVAIFLLLFLFRRFNVTKKQKQLIEFQKAAMEEKQIELSNTHIAIKDSINYSKKIQKAIFPSKEDMSNVFENNFILFKPKDIVSGDFYWCYEFGNKKVLVVADCTGHGVPGAFMTIIGINILKEIIQNGVSQSAEVLKQINIELKNRLGQNNESVKDGMDLGICIIDDKMIEYSGAHFPLYHVTGNNLIEYKGSNTFLGIDDNLNNIKTHYIPYKKDDQIYMVTDGFPDQRGGIKGKKYYYKPLRDLLQRNSHLELSEQKKIMQKEFESWLKTSNQKQMDDVTVIGIKF